MAEPILAEPILAVEDLKVAFQTADGEVEAVRGVSFSVGAGECLGLVGESGSGKSQTVMAAMGLLPPNGRATGQVRFEGRPILGLAPRALNRIRGSQMSMVFQDPMTALTPHLRIGEQITEPLRRHLGLGGAASMAKAREWLERLRIPEPVRRLQQYPHELSGGMRQRVMIAIAMACGPKLLIADEPTTALDATVQADILDLMDELKAQTGTAVVLITHDMGVIARLADRVCVMKDGRIVEQAPVRQLFSAPASDYARMLLAAVPRLDRDAPARSDRAQTPPETAPPENVPSENVPSENAPPENAPSGNAPMVIEARDLQVWFPVQTAPFMPKRKLRAVDGVSLSLRQGETLGVVGESGSGKSTLARAVLKLLPADGGAVSVLGRDLTKADRKAMQAARKDLQIVFQDPLASLDPRMSVGQSIAEPLVTFRPHLRRTEREAEVLAMMRQVGLPPDLLNRYPHELSGGQNQRVGIARAMILEPKLVVCDEAVSALDVSIRAQIIELLIALQRQRQMAMLFISHDLAVVREVSHRVLVLYMGRVVEEAGRDQLYADARHPYTRSLLSAALIPDPDLARRSDRLRLAGEPPSPFDPQAGLRFLASRRSSDPKAEIYRPKLIEAAPGHLVAEFDPV